MVMKFHCGPEINCSKQIDKFCLFTKQLISASNEMLYKSSEHLKYLYKKIEIFIHYFLNIYTRAHTFIFY